MSVNSSAAKSVISMSQMDNFPADMIDPRTILTNQGAIEAALNVSKWLVKSVFDETAVLYIGYFLHTWLMSDLCICFLKCIFFRCLVDILAVDAFQLSDIRNKIIVHLTYYLYGDCNA